MLWNFFFHCLGEKVVEEFFCSRGGRNLGIMSQHQLSFGNGLLDIKFIKVLFLMGQHKVRDHGDTKTDPGQI